MPIGRGLLVVFYKKKRRQIGSSLFFDHYTKKITNKNTKEIKRWWTSSSSSSTMILIHKKHVVNNHLFLRKVLDCYEIFEIFFTNLILKINIWKKLKHLNFTRFLCMVQVGSQKYIWMFFFLKSYFVNNRIWLNQLTNDYHLGYITKLKTKNKSGGTLHNGKI
jgi:hypothetical protein